MKIQTRPLIDTLGDAQYSTAVSLLLISLMQEKGINDYEVTKTSMSDRPEVAACLERNGDLLRVRLIPVSEEDLKESGMADLRKIAERMPDDPEGREATIPEEGDDIHPLAKMIMGLMKEASDDTHVAVNEDALANPHYAKAVTMALVHLMRTQRIYKFKLDEEERKNLMDNPIGLNVDDMQGEGIKVSLDILNTGSVH